MVSSGFTAQRRVSGILKKRTGRRSLQQEDCSKRLISVSAPKRHLRSGKWRGHVAHGALAVPRAAGVAGTDSPQRAAEMAGSFEVTQAAQISMASGRKPGDRLRGCRGAHGEISAVSEKLFFTLLRTRGMR